MTTTPTTTRPLGVDLTRSPVRCNWAPLGHDAPAVRVLTMARTCGHPDPFVHDAPSCVDDLRPVGALSAPSPCLVCGVDTRVVITGVRAVTEGDLP